MEETHMKVAVLGSGAGALAVAADMSRHGRDTVLADVDDFGANLEPVAESGGVPVSSDWHDAPVEPDTGVAIVPVAVAAGIPEALDGAVLAVVVPCLAHERWVQAIAPHVTADQTDAPPPRPAGSTPATSPTTCPARWCWRRRWARPPACPPR